MAIAWLTVLQSVPWGEVVGNAPKVAAGAKKLWSAVTRKPAMPSAATAESQMALTPGPQSIAALASRILALEAESAELQGQMLASSELIQALAEQNTQLILRIETQRFRIGWLAGGCAVAVVVAATGMVLLLMR